MKKRFLRTILLVGLIMSIAVVSCACAAKPDVLSEEEISALRKTYAYGEYDPSLDISYPETLDAKLMENYVYAVVTITDGWTDPESFTIAPNDELAPTTGNALYLSVHIDSIICEINCHDQTFETGDRILHFRPLVESRGYDYFVPGARFVMLINKTEACSTVLKKYPDHYEGSIMDSFLITDENRIVSLNPAAYMDNYTGWSLDSFETELKGISWTPYEDTILVQ